MKSIFLSLFLLVSGVAWADLITIEPGSTIHILPERGSTTVTCSGRTNGNSNNPVVNCFCKNLPGGSYGLVMVSLVNGAATEAVVGNFDYISLCQNALSKNPYCSR